MTADSSTNRRPARCAIDVGERGLAGAGRPPEDHGRPARPAPPRPRPAAAAASPGAAGGPGRRPRRACAAACGRRAARSPPGSRSARRCRRRLPKRRRTSRSSRQASLVAPVLERLSRPAPESIVRAVVLDGQSGRPAVHRDGGTGGVGNEGGAEQLTRGPRTGLDPGQNARAGLGGDGRRCPTPSPSCSSAVTVLPSGPTTSAQA